MSATPPTQPAAPVVVAVEAKPPSKKPLFYLLGFAAFLWVLEAAANMAPAYDLEVPNWVRFLIAVVGLIGTAVKWILGLVDPATLSGFEKLDRKTTASTVTPPTIEDPRT